eukprot:GHVU01014086.1.p2 GENE.GHVU01014086.1~~GHVU01014086.1.p2  ORF type:complete len:139 (+),score=8.20 GHVU01014086.1:1861-2277(+)
MPKCVNESCTGSINHREFAPNEYPANAISPAPLFRACRMTTARTIDYLELDNHGDESHQRFYRGRFDHLSNQHSNYLMARYDELPQGELYDRYTYYLHRSKTLGWEVFEGFYDDNPPRAVEDFIGLTQHGAYVKCTSP